MSLPQSAIDFMAGHVAALKQIRPKKRIVFPEGNDPRIVAAAERLALEELVEPVLVCEPRRTPPPGVRCAVPDGKYTALYYERRRAKGITMMEAESVCRQPLYYAALMVSAGDADGSVGGASNSTAETVRAALHCIGTSPKVRTVSSIFFVCGPDPRIGKNGVVAMADCAIIPDPTAMQLAEIAISTAASARCLLRAEPVVALLSFSTKGSGGKHPHVLKVTEAMKYIRERAPDLHIDGELQADAALEPEVGASKAKGSTVAGRANTLVFPDLDAGNIGHKLAITFSGGAGIGPFLQGLAKPANDLSRGCTAEEIYGAAVITAVQSVVDYCG
jgi:phosphate acetyltransferase